MLGSRRNRRAENLGVKHANWDRKAGYVVPRDCYNSYFYAVEDTSLTILDKFKLHGKDYIKYLADVYKDGLNEKVYKALYAYEVEITD